MNKQVERLLRSLGVWGIGGLGILAACAAFYFTALAPASQELTDQRTALEQLQARTPNRPVAMRGHADELRRFYGLFPAAEGLTIEVERLHNLARRVGLDLSQGDYRLEQRSLGLWAYRVNLPVRGTYVQIREFGSSILKEVPVASIDTLRFERRTSSETQLEAHVSLTIHVRPHGEYP
jgi:hypothetical protein